MPVKETGRVGERGTLVIPARLRRIFGIEEGSELIAEETPEGILLMPAVTIALELYGPERKAEFILSNSVDAEDYALAVAEVRALGLDPDAIPHRRPEDA